MPSRTTSSIGLHPIVEVTSRGASGESINCITTNPDTRSHPRSRPCDGIEVVVARNMNEGRSLNLARRTQRPRQEPYVFVNNNPPLQLARHRGIPLSSIPPPPLQRLNSYLASDSQSESDESPFSAGPSSAAPPISAIVSEDLEFEFDGVLVSDPGALGRQMARPDMNALNRFRWQGSDRTDRCAVCLERIQAGQDVITPPCLHIFHNHCLDGWMFLRASCPVCRLNFGAS